jgi:hypothetical protein
MIYYPPDPILNCSLAPSIFLAGTIELGNSVDWQSEAINSIISRLGVGINIFNPRRKDWDSSWVQSIENPNFYRQVDWELRALDLADYILMFFDPKSKSPISLLELGLYATSKKMMVVCPNGFWRKGNVEMVCEKYNIPLFTAIDLAIYRLEYKIKN